jgi:pimeloyl-ACP methyl ester carboxylesterase
MCSDVGEHKVIDVGSTRLDRQMRGSGQPVLGITGGIGDPGQWSGIARVLAGEYTVVTYHRRGVSRSPRLAGGSTSGIAEQADNAAMQTFMQAQLWAAK